MTMLSTYVTLGRTGLRLSPLALGTMTFDDGDDPKTGGAGRKAVLAQLDASLRRLDTEYVDVYWMHLWDRHTPPEETPFATATADGWLPPTCPAGLSRPAPPRSAGLVISAVSPGARGMIGTVIPRTTSRGGEP